jgi:hypothetical protein
MKIKFQADHDFDARIIRALLRVCPVIDFQTAPAAGIHLGTPDDKVLAIAAAEGRLLVSHDKRTMPRHFGQFILNQSSPGVFIVSRGLPIGEAAYWLHLIWEASEAEEYVNIIHHIPWQSSTIQREL